MVSNIDCCQALSTNYIRVNDYFSTLETTNHNGSLAICNQSWKSAVPFSPSCGFVRFFAFLLFLSFLPLFFPHFSCLVCPFRCVKVRSLYFSGMCGRSILLNVLSFIQIDPSFIMYSTHPILLNMLSFIQIDQSFIIYSTHPTLSCLWACERPKAGACY